MENSNQNTPQFSPLRNFLWPIHNFELKKFIPTCLIMCCILFNYTLLRNTKDSLILSATDAGTITFLKLYFVTPFAVLFMVAYVRMSNFFSKENIFYALMVPFLMFFALFGFLLNPYLDLVQPSAATVANLRASFPALGGFINIFANWVYSLFFILSELWGSVMLSLAFWSFTNQITRFSEAKRFYGRFLVVGNLALMVCGGVVSFFSEGIRKFLPAGTSNEIAWQYSVYFLMTSVVIVGILAMIVYRWMHTQVLPDPRYYEGPKPEKVKKAKPGFFESLKLIFTSKELGLIVLLVICYGVTINLVEVQWKNQVKVFFGGDKGSMNAFMGAFSFWTGLVTIVFALFFGANILSRFGWFISAIFTPFVVLAGGSIMFLTIFVKDFPYVANLLASYNISPAYAATIIGAIIVIAAKATKYSLFDSTKEMAYIPLSDEIKTKGKSAADVVGGRAGKSGGAFVQSTLLMILGTTSVIDIAGISGTVFVVMCVAWMYAVKRLNTTIAKAEEQRANAVTAVPTTAVTTMASQQDDSVQAATTATENNSNDVNSSENGTDKV